ncbi:protein rep, partial [Vagococcus zengguangii]
IMDKLTVSGIERFKTCSTYNEFIATKDKKHKKNIRNNSCKNRFCPICSWKKANKNALELTTLVKAIESEKKQEFIFMTLTTPNVKENELSNEIDRFNNAFKKLFKRRNVARSINGYVRKLEVTYNKERDDYNPHFHVLMSVDKSYFKKPEKYIKQSEWLDMWREVTGLDEITQVHVTKVKNQNEGKNSKGTAINEVAKYSVKDIEMSENKEVFDTFYNALRGRQLITFNGNFKEYHAKYKNKELIKYIDKDTHEYVLKLFARWNDDLMKYEQTYQELTEEEKREYNGALIDEIETDD